MTGSILGNRVIRKEDPKFLTTGGVYVDDMDEPLLEGALHVTYARSVMAHARITAIDTAAAAGAPGVVAVYTAADLGLEPVPAAFNPAAARTLLASDVVRYVGEPLAAIVTERKDQGEDAAELIEVDYEPLEVLLDVEAAAASSTHLYPAAGSNVVFDSTALGMPGLTDESFFEGCDVVVSERLVNQRLAPCPLEVRGSAAAWVDGRLHQWVSTQHAQGARESLAAANGVEGADVRVITPDVGGGFGAKIGTYSEEQLLGRLSKELGRPVSWRETRSESMVALGHGRAQVQHITLGGSRDGQVLAYRLRVFQDCGAVVEIGTVLAAFMTRPMSSGVYAIPKIECHTSSVVTNTTPIVAYRGAGRPEAAAAIERAMDLFAAEIGMDPVDVRRRNLIPKFEEPHTTTIGQTYDVGDYETALDNALGAAGYADLRAEQAARRASGDPKQLGIGVSVYVEITGGAPQLHEDARIVLREDGGAIVYTGTSPHGQGHVTAWSMIASSDTGIPMDQIDVIWGDTDLVSAGGGTMGSRSLQQGGSAVHVTAEALVEAAKQIAAGLLEADVADVVLDIGAGGLPRGRHARRHPDLGRGGGRRRGRGRAQRGGDLHRGERHLPLRLPRRRGRGRHRDGQGASPPPGGLRRRRPCPQPDAPRGPDPRRHRAGRGAGADGGGPLRRGRQPRHLQPGRLRLHLGGRAAQFRGRPHGDADAREPAGRQGHRRVGHHRVHPRRPVGRDRRAPALGRAPRRHAGHPPADLGGHPGRSHERLNHCAAVPPAAPDGA